MYQQQIRLPNKGSNAEPKWNKFYEHSHEPRSHEDEECSLSVAAALDDVLR